MDELGSDARVLLLDTFRRTFRSRPYPTWESPPVGTVVTADTILHRKFPSDCNSNSRMVLPKF